MESSINQCEQWICRSDKSLQAATTLFKMGFYSDSISRAYYAVFYCLRGLYTQDKKNAFKPSTILSILGKEYVTKGKLEPAYHKSIFQIFDLRYQTEYECKEIDNVEIASYVLENASLVINEIKNTLINKDIISDDVINNDTISV